MTRPIPPAESCHCGRTESALVACPVHSDTRVLPPAGGITPGGNPTCPKCGRWYGPGEKHECPIPPEEAKP